MINYPNGKKACGAAPVQTGKISAGGRGMELEKEINITNKSYLNSDIAVIHKKPTPPTILHVD